MFFLIKTNRNKWFPFCKSDEELPGAGRLGTNQQKPPSTGRSRPEHLKRSWTGGSSAPTIDIIIPWYKSQPHVFLYGGGFHTSSILIGCSLINIYTPSILGYPHFLLPHMIPLRSHPLAGVCSAKSYALLPNCAPARDLSELPPGRLLPPRPSLRGIREGVHGRCWWDAKPQRKGKWMHKKKDA